jgi:translation initiation factor 2 beta subunit (eIF-2beta)/eIF-5
MLYFTYEQTIQQHHDWRNAITRSIGIRLFMLTSITEDVRGVLVKDMKRNRLRKLVLWGRITQSEANQLWRDYLRLFKRVNQKGK